MAHAHGPGGRYLTEEEIKNRPRVTKALLLRVFSYLKPYRAQLVLVLLLIIVSSSFSLAPSIISGKILDEGLIARMTSDIDGVQRIISGTFTSILTNVITLVIAVIAMFQKKQSPHAGGTYEELYHTQFKVQEHPETITAYGPSDIY